MGTGDDMVCGRDNFADEGTKLIEAGNGSNPNNYILKVDGGEEITIHGVNGGPGDGVRGEAVVGAGVRGIAYSEGVAGVMGQGEDDCRYGVEGLLSGASVPDNRIERAAVVGCAAGSQLGIGVMGISDSFQGVLGSSQTQPGVEGLSTSGDGVHGNSFEGIGVRGEGATTGVLAYSERGTGLSARGSQFAGFFWGSVLVFRGDFTVIGGAKSAAVPHPDGAYRRLYALETPESWFEDFGEANLVDGKAQIKLDPDFAKLVKTDKYHVFLTSYADSYGLYVANRTDKGFEVRERQGGKSKLSISYRVVAKRKDIPGERLAKITLPAIPSELTRKPNAA